MKETHKKLLEMVNEFCEFSVDHGLVHDESAHLLMNYCRKCRGWTADCDVCHGTNVMVPSESRLFQVLVEMLEAGAYLQAHAFGTFVKENVL